MAITKVTSGLISADASSIDLNIDAGTLYLDVSENRVGIGTSSPSQALEVTGITLSDGYRTAEDNTNYSLLTRNSSNTAVYIQQAGSGNILDVQSGSAGAGQGTSRLLVTSSGNVGIGRTSIAQPSSGATTLAIQGTSTTKGGAIRLYSSDDSVAAYIYPDSTSGLSINTSTSHPMVFRTAGSERMRIDSSGNLIVGKTSTDFNTAGFHLAPEGALYSGIQTVSASSSYHLRDTTNNTWEFYVTGAGQIHATSTSITSLSDERLKENIKDLETGLTEVMSLKPRRFDWKDRKEKNVAGFIAQEVETVLPDLIDDFMHDDLEDAKSVKMSDMIPTLVKAIQELSDKVDNQQTIIDNLKTRIETLENA